MTNVPEEPMNLTRARELREERSRLFNEGRSAYDASPKSKEDETKFNLVLDKVDQLKGKIDWEERIDNIEAEMRGSTRPPAGAVDPGSPETLSHVAEYRKAEKRHGVKAITTVRAEVRQTVENLNADYWEAMRLYLGCAPGELPPEARNILGGSHEGLKGLGCGSAKELTARFEKRDMGTGGGNALQGVGAGYFVPVGFVDEIEEAMKWYGDMLRSSTMMRTATGQPLPYPTDNDTSNTGELVGENKQVSEQDVTIGSIEFNAWKYSTKMIKVSIELLQDSAFDLEGYVKGKFAERLGRILNTHFTVGTGASQPNGILTAATQAQLNGNPYLAIGSSANDGSGSTGGTTIGTDDLVNLEHSVDKAYRRGSAYMANDTTIRLLKTLKDKYGRPIWLPGIAINAPDTINGYEYFTNNDLPTVALNAKTMLFGALKKYLIRAVKELAILRLNERYADYGQVAFIGFARYDGDLLDAGTHPVSYLQQAAA
jgi:HK97 family phage major capsid protein